MSGRAGRIAIGPAFGEFGGVSQHVRNLARASRHAPEMFRLPAWSVWHPAWRRAFWILETNRLRFPDPWILALARRLRGADLVHLHAYPLWIDAYLRKENPRAKYVYTVHQIFELEDVPTREWPRWRALNERLFDAAARCDAVVSVAAWQAEELRRRGVEAEVIPNGVDLAGLAGGDGGRFRKAYGVEEPFFLFAASLLPYKRPELLADLARRMPDRTFVAVGRGTDAAGLAAYLGETPPKNLRAFGEIPRADLVDAYAACRAFVLTSARDTFPTALLEAMAAGKPVVGSASAGPAEIVADKTNGYLFRPDDASSLEDAARRAWDASPAIGAAARKRAEEFDWPRVAARVDALYARLLEVDA